MSNQSTQELIEERTKEYGNAWKISGNLLVVLETPLMALLRLNPDAFFPWLMIHNKLIRLLANPNHLDSWRDIAGYAELMVQELERESAEKGEEPKW